MQDILLGSAKITGKNAVKYFMPGRVDVGGEVTAKNIMIATGSVPFVPPGANLLKFIASVLLRQSLFLVFTHFYLECTEMAFLCIVSYWHVETFGYGQRRNSDSGPEVPRLLWLYQSTSIEPYA